jgi:glutamate---cysteine ligase / carboxylate-amine ligase
VYPTTGVTPAIDAVRFGTEAAFAIGVEEELILVDHATLALSHSAAQVLDRVELDPALGEAKPDTYAGMIELATTVMSDAGQCGAALSSLRAGLREAGSVVIGAGLHPDAAFGDVVHVDEERYVEIDRQVRGLLSRTPTAALHVHVGMPDAETAIRACNGLREHLPLLQALAANSPFWYGQDSGLASARAQVFRAFPRSEIPRAFASYEEYAEIVESVARAGDLTSYTFLWWDIRPHPRMGTVEVRAMDCQASLWATAGLAALVHGLARAEAEGGDEACSPREALMEASFTAARDGTGARLPLECALRPVREVALAALERARPHARELGSEDALAGIERILAEGNGAERQRAAFARGGMRALLEHLVAEARAPYG